MSMSNQDDLRPRLCHLKLWVDFPGYGFNLMSKRGRPGHFVESIDDNSPATSAGLRNGDKIIEVNGENIVNLPHSQVAELIKTSPAGEVKILVVDEATEEDLKSKGIVIKSGTSMVLSIKGAQTKPSNISLASDALLRTQESRDGKRGRQNSADFTRFSMPEPPNSQSMDTDIVENDGNKTIIVAARQDTIVAVKQSGLRVRSHTLPDSDHQSDENGIELKPQIKPQVNGVPRTEKRVSIAVPDQEQRSITRNGPRSESNISNQEDGPTARLCILVKSIPSESFGFNLRTYEDTKEKIITKVDDGGVAMRTGLRLHDIVVEINGINVAQENHKQITSRLKQSSTEVKLLVLRQEDVLWYKANGLVAKSNQKNLVTLRTPGAQGTPVMNANGTNNNSMARSTQGYDNMAFEGEVPRPSPRGSNLRQNIPRTPEVIAATPDLRKARTSLRTEYSVESTTNDEFLMNLNQVSVPEIKGIIGQKVAERPDGRKDSPQDFARKHQIVENLGQTRPNESPQI